MHSKGHRPQVPYRFYNVTKGTLSRLFRAIRVTFLLIAVKIFALSRTYLSLMSFLSSSAHHFQAGSDSGAISSMRPRCNRNTRWHRRANDKLCVAIREVSWCSRCNRAIKANTDSAVWVSRSPVGSSASKSFGPVMRARARATRCCSPPESSPER